jgi:hypothetical protein
MIKVNEHIMRHSRGPQFRAFGEVFFAFGIVFLIILMLVELIAGNLIFSVLLLCMCIASVSYILNIHGFEIDAAENKIRDYRKFLWFRIGDWKNMSDFKHVYLTRGKVVVPASEYSRQQSDTYYYFFVKLVDEKNKKELVLSEFRDYKKALKLMKNIAGLLRIEEKIIARQIERIE